MRGIRRLCHLFVPIINLIAYDVHQDSAFWGIRFPFRASSFDEAAVGIIEDDLEGGWNTVLKTGLQGPYFSSVGFPIKVEMDWELIEHIPRFP